MIPICRPATSLRVTTDDADAEIQRQSLAPSSCWWARRSPGLPRLSSSVPWIRLREDTWILFTLEQGAFKTLVVTAICLLCLYFADLYDFRRASEPGELFVRIVQALGAASFLLARHLLLVPGARSSAAACSCVSSFLVIAGVIGVAARVRAGSRRRVGPRERLLLVGTSPAAVEPGHASCFERGDTSSASRSSASSIPIRLASAQPVFNPGVIGTIEDIPSIVRARGVDRVVVSLADARGKLPMDKLLEMKLDGVTLRSPGVGLRGVHRQDRRREPASELADLLGRVPQEPAGCDAVKRTLDIVVGLHRRSSWPRR